MTPIKVIKNNVNEIEEFIYNCDVCGKSYEIKYVVEIDEKIYCENCLKKIKTVVHELSQIKR